MSLRVNKEAYAFTQAALHVAISALKEEPYERLPELAGSLTAASRLLEQLREESDRLTPEGLVPPNEIVRRKEDMSPDGELFVMMQGDGDMIIGVKPSKDDMDYEGSPFGVSVEFCTPVMGGGRSPHTLRALRVLAEAVVKDNEGGR